MATIMLNRPDRMNAFNQTMLDEMQAAWKTVREDVEIRAVVLRAAEGRAFCTGVDVIEIFDTYRQEPFRELDPGQVLGPKSNLVWKPIVVAIHGMCAGGGFYFINEADIIICSDDAQFFDPHVSYGLVPACEPVGVSHRMPYGEIMRMILLGNDERIGAETALRINLVSEITTHDRLWERAHSLAAAIARKPATATQGAVKAMWESLDLPHTAAVRGAYKYIQVGNPVAELDRSQVARTKAEIR
ncbi:enoyl-CoA hydratase/isomerase family protein [Rhizorhapis sp. SPR117]|uniref:enoyl-CoA hydratase/isomerase family protein n=1 Tax=Rhizorhapis sp. SPR117 TaxID=2912611 RepID=UPI001F3E0F9B|nr:enoyl-CoA hydratase/isomerase family protein [Rhizorhapis sp. SPR117]